MKRIAPFVQFAFALPQEMTDEALKGLGERRIRNVALVLIEFARSEETARGNEDPVQLVDDGGLADAGIAGDQHQLWPAARYHAIEGGEQGCDLALPPVQLLGGQHPVRRVVFTEREVVDQAVSLPRGEAAPGVPLEIGRALV